MSTTFLGKKRFDYIETKIETPNGIVPVVFGYELCTLKKQAITYKKDLYTMHFVVSGRGYVNKNLVGENQLFLLYPGSKMSYRPDSQNPWFYLWIEFEGLLVLNYLDHCGLSIQNNVIQLESMDEIINIFNKIFFEVNSNLNRHARNILFEAYTMEIFSYIIEECGYRSKNKGKSFQELNFEKIIIYINSNFTNPNLTVSYISKEFSYASSYLTRLFKKYINMSPCKYITKLRMEKASELLKKKEYSINQVSSLVGYQSQFYFSKVYLNYYGIRPSQYDD